MNCPACKNTNDHPPVLQLGELEPGLNVMSCPECAGVFLEHFPYTEWAKSAGHADIDKPVKINVKPSSERAGAKFCAHCKSYLVKYDVAADASFTIDRCGKCGGMWLDGNEWDQLKSRSLHTDIHRIFSTDWQSQIRANEHGKALEDIWREQFGSDYEELMRIKKWIDSHAKAPEVYAFLQAERIVKKSMTSSV